MQNHYVGLDRINIVDDSQSDTPMVVNLPPNSDNPASTSAGIDDQSPKLMPLIHQQMRKHSKKMSILDKSQVVHQLA